MLMLMKAGKLRHAQLYLLFSFPISCSVMYKRVDNAELIYLIAIRCTDRSYHNACYLSKTMSYLWKKVQEHI